MDDGNRGLRDGAPPRLSPLGVAVGVGAIWGLLGYSVLWEGAPFAVDRPFVQSAFGTIVLLPVRSVLWGIHFAEGSLDRTFDFSRNHWWIGILAGAIGAALAIGLGWLARTILRRLRPPVRAGFDTRR